ncbi:MAG: hypothetical protein AAF799_42420 [Myxococcota bacterium]
MSLVVLPACPEEDPPEQTTTEQSEDSTTTFSPATGSNTPMADTVSEETSPTLDEETGKDPMGGQCDMFAQDCNEGEKCVPWSENADLVPDDIRCCPISQPEVQAGDICVVDGYFGSCMDNCTPGTICLDIDGDGEGVCQEMCGGEPDNPECENGIDDECFVYYGGVPLCFAKCDPLLQDCPSDKGCYPDAIAEGGTGFLCMPTVGDNPLGGYCWLLSNCNPGMICATPDLLPNCFGGAGDAGCCTDLCDITESPDPCQQLHEDMECVPWYYQGAPPPSTELQNVGACVLPTVGGGA